MKKILFFLINFIVFFGLGYAAFRFVYIGIGLEQAKYFDSYTSAEKLESNITFWLPIVILIGIEAAALIIGKKCFEKWGWKDCVITVLTSVAGIAASGLVLTLLNP